MKIKIASPIFGFEELKDVELEKIDEFFSKLSADELSLTLLNPSLVREYHIDIPSSYETLLDIDEKDEIEFYAVMILQNPIENSYVNFAAPIIVNKSKNLLAQVALDEKKYPHFGLSEPIASYL